MSMRSLPARRDPAAAPGTLPAARTEIPALTTVRFFAAFAVVLFHYGDPILSWGRGLARTASPLAGALIAVAAAPLEWATRWGYLGVSFFFVLSGFILTHVYLGGAAPRAIPLRRFWVARFARVYPVYLLGMLLCAPFVLLGSVDRYGAAGAPAHIALSAVPALLLVHGWIAARVPLWNFPSWSVGAEAFFYLLFPWIAPRLARFSPRRQAISAGLIWLAGMALPVAFVLLDPAAARDSGFQPGSADHGAMARLFQDAPIFHVHQFFLGVVAGRWFEARGSTLRGDWLTLAGLGLVALLLGLGGGLPAPVLLDGLLAPAFALVILGLAAGGRLARLLSGETLLLLGAASYALYILQNPLSDLLTVAFVALRPDLLATPAGHAGEAAFVILTLVAASLLVLRGLENPARHWLVGRLGARRAAAIAPVVTGEAGR